MTLSKDEESLLAAVRAAVAQGDDEDAYQILRVGARQLPQSVPLLINLCQFARATGRYEEAVEQGKRARALQPDDPQVLYYLGDALRQNWELDEALSVHERCLELSPGVAAAEVALAHTRIENDLPDLALPVIERHLGERPKDAMLVVLRCLAQVRMGRHRDAAAGARAIIETSPGSLPALVILAEALRALGQTDAWVSAACEAYRQNTDSPLGRLWMGVAAEAMGNFGEARHYLEQALSLQPRLYQAHAWLGTIAWEAGALDEAEGHLRKAASIAPGKGQSSGLLAQFQVKTGRDEPDLAALEQQAQRRPYCRLSYNLSRIAILRGEMDEARRWLRFTVEHGGEAVADLKLLGDVEMARGEAEEAVPHFRKAVELCPDFGDAWVGLGAALLNSGEPEEARAAYAQAVEQEGESAAARYGYGVALTACEEAEAAVEQLTIGVELAPEDGETRYALADALSEAGRAAEALTALEEAEALLGQDDRIAELRARLTEAEQPTP